MNHFNFKYFTLAIMLSATEILIGVCAHDQIIRPYFGDLLIGIFVYCAIKTLFDYQSFTTAISVLYFCYAVEISQHFNLIRHLGLQNSAAARIILGSQFSWIDMISYTIGISIVIWLENGRPSMEDHISIF